MAQTVDAASGTPAASTPAAGPVETLDLELADGSCSITLPAPGAAGHSKFSFGVAKSGTVMLFTILDALLEDSHAYTPVDIPAQLFVQGFHVNDMTPEAFDTVFARPGYSFQGFRQFPAQLDLAALESRHAVVQVRDPRDVLTSLYFAIKSSHHVPESGPEGERLAAARAELQQLDIDDFVLKQSREVMGEYDFFVDRLLHDDAVTLIRYEDVIFDKRGYVETLANWLGVVHPPERLDAIAAAVDQRPAGEDASAHVRQVEPGDHVRKLHHDTILELTRRFQNLLARFEYPEHAPSGLGLGVAPSTDAPRHSWDASHLHPSSLESYLARLHTRATTQSRRWFGASGVADVPPARAQLDAVMVPLTAGELPKAVQNIEAWNTALPPFTGSSAERPAVDLVFVLNRDVEGRAVHLIERTMEMNRNAAAAFANVRVTSAGLHGKYDVYEADLPVGPNNMFLFCMGALDGYDTVLQLETDCEIREPNWLQLAADCVRDEMGSKWVMGSHYRGLGDLESAARRHINGNAFYRTGDPRFQEFVWEIYTQHFVASLSDPYMLGYDAAMTVLVEQADAALASAVTHRFGFTDFIHNYRTSDDAAMRGGPTAAVIAHFGAGSPKTLSEQLADEARAEMTATETSA